MFIRAKRSKGHTYYEVVENYRDEHSGKVRHRRIAYIGISPTVSAAFDRAESDYFESRKGRTRGPFTEADRKAWVRLRKLQQLLRHDRDEPLELDRVRRLSRESERWDRWNTREARSARARSRALGVLDLGDRATPDEIRAARDRLAKRHHPDLGGDPAKMAEINEAYESLRDSRP